MAVAGTRTAAAARSRCRRTLGARHCGDTVIRPRGRRAVRRRECPGDDDAQGDARLLGVFAEADGAGYALFRFADRGPVLVKAGADIASGMTLVEVRPRGVRIRDHGELRDLELRSASAGERATGRSTAPAAPARRVRAAVGIQGPDLSPQRRAADRNRVETGELDGAARARRRRARGARRLGIRDDARDEARRPHGAGQRHRAFRHRRRPGRVRQSADREPDGARGRHARRQAGRVAVRQRRRVSR